jgi:hypothetical protein
MGIHSKIAEPGEAVLPRDVLARYELLEDCIVSGQVSDGEAQTLLREDPGFARWLKARALERIARRSVPAI